MGVVRVIWMGARSLLGGLRMVVDWIWLYIGLVARILSGEEKISTVRWGNLVGRGSVTLMKLEFRSNVANSSPSRLLCEGRSPRMWSLAFMSVSIMDL